MIERKKDLFTLLAKHQEQLKQFGVKRWGVFGSFARDQQNDRSDVDILVEFEQGKKSFAPRVFSRRASRKES
jgi:predicted nucleotidyltransferase